LRILEARAEKLRQEMDRGRGGDVISPFPVSLEPPYTPFRHRGPDTTPSSIPQDPPAGRIDPIPASDLTCLEIRLSPEDDYNHDLSEQLILALSLSHPVAFELVGHDGGISLQYIAAKEDAPTIVNILRSHYPRAQVSETPDPLYRAETYCRLGRNYRLKDSHLFQIGPTIEPKAIPL